MKKLLLVLAAWILTGVTLHLSAQCPTLYDLKINDGNEASICAPGQVELSVRGIQMPSKGAINWYYSEDENFDPRTQGTLIGKTDLPEHTQQQCPAVCPDLLMIMMNSCDGTGSEPDNEFFIFSSGSGFFADDVQFRINESTNASGAANHSINIGSNPCQIQRPSNAFMTRLRDGACSNLNLFAAGPGDYIPSDALVIFYMSSNVTIDYDLTTLCGSGHNVYVMQSACQRTMGAFTNVLNNPNSPNNTRNNMFSLRNCTSCRDSLNYSLVGVRNMEGEYIIDNDFALASVANGSILLNTEGDPCQTPDLSNYLKPNNPYKIYFGVTANSPLCGKKIYFKAHVTPYDAQICTEVIASGAALNIQCGGTLQVNAPASVCSGNPLEIDLGSTGDFTWTVSAPNGVTGLSGGSGNVSSIKQTPVYSGTQPVTVSYTISSNSTDCPVNPVTVQVTVGPALSATILGTTQICSGEKTTLSVNTNASSILWNTGATSASIEVTASGTYSVTLSNSICSATASVQVVVSDELKPTISGRTSICQGESTTLKVNENFDSYTWSNGESGKSITVTGGGTYTVEVKNGNCTGTASVTVVIGGSIDVDTDITPVSCKGNDGSVTLDIENGVTYSVLWNTGETGETISGKAAGTYTYTIQYGNCTQQGSVEIPQSQVTITADVEVEPVNCDATEKGAISITNVNNGVAPYIVKINGTQINETLSDLDAGDYTLTIEDASGCILQQTVNVFQAPAVNVILPQDISITQGQQITLQANVTGTNIQPEETVYQWTPSAGLSCVDCLSPVASPTETTEYILTVTNAFGCEDEDTIRIEVLPVMSVYLPTAFSPNGDGKNDVLYILSNTPATKIKIFEIFNRWGESVFKVENVNVNNPAFGWNGFYKGKASPVDNYSFYYEVEFPDATVKRDKGSVLIVR